MGYQYASTDAIDTVYGTGHNNINSHYFDGISLTHGSPCQHIWTFMAGINEHSTLCPCTNGTTQIVQFLLVVITSANLGTQAIAGRVNYTQPILSGMVKTVVLLNIHVIKLLVSHGSKRSLTLPLLTMLRCKLVGVKIHMMRMSLLINMRFT